MVLQEDMSRNRNNKIGDFTKKFISLVFVLFVCFILLSLITYSEEDIYSIHYPSDKPISNAGGRIGAFLSYFFLHNFGIAAFPLIFFIGFWTFVIFLYPTSMKQVGYTKPRFSYVNLVSTFIFILSFATFMSIQPIVSEYHFRWRGTAPSVGGVYGKAMELFLTEYFGQFGTYLITILIGFLSLVVATNWLIYDWFLFLKKWAGLLLGKIYQLIRSKYTKIRLEKEKVQKEKDRAKLQKEIDEEIKRLEYQQAQTNGFAPTANTNGGEDTFGEIPRPSEVKNAPSFAQKSSSQYKPPPIDLFEDKVERIHHLTEKDIKERVIVIENALKNFGIIASVTGYETGPTVTVYELELAPGVKYSKVVALTDDIAIALAAPNVRVIAPIPNKSTIGIEVPNPFPDVVRIKDFLTAPEALKFQKIPLPIFLGKDNSGVLIVKNLADMPHLLIAGTTGAGKSVCLNSIITSLVINLAPDDMKFILVDPKMVELSAFKDIPHLWVPVLTDMKRVPAIFDWLIKEMDDRYLLLSRAGVRKMEDYNQLGEKFIKGKFSEDGEVPEGVPTHLPYIVVVIDELADLMMMSAKEVEYAITRISQKARAVGIHLVIATQRPSVDVITGLIKSNIPTRISFKVAAKVDSRTILDQNGAERLLGKGDMLLVLPGLFAPIRAQCTYTSEKEIHNVVDFLRKQGKPVYHKELMKCGEDEGIEGTDRDELFDEAVKIVLETQRGSVSLLQRRLSIGYTRAARLIDHMEKLGIVGEYKGASAREVLLTQEEWEARKSRAT